MKKLLLIALMAVVGLGAVGCVSTTTETPVVEKQIIMSEIVGDWAVSPAGTYDELFIGAEGYYNEYVETEMTLYGDLSLANNIITMVDFETELPRDYKIIGFEANKITVEVGGKTEVWTPFE